MVAVALEWFRINRKGLPLPVGQLEDSKLKNPRVAGTVCDRPKVSAGVYFVCSHLAIALQVRQAWNDGETLRNMECRKWLTGRSNKSICWTRTMPTSLPAAAIHDLTTTGGDWYHRSPHQNQFHYPGTPKTWDSRTMGYFNRSMEVACEYEPTVEDFRLLAEFLWENQESVEVD